MEVEDKYGIMDLNGNIIIPAKYSEIEKFGDNFYEVKIGGKTRYNDEGLHGLITLEGNTVIPIIYNHISMDGDVIICENDEGSTLYKVIQK